MDTSNLSTLYDSPGPFATVLIDVGHDNENGEHEHELRVRAAADQLREEGADEAVVEAVSARLRELVHQPAPVARLVVANGDGVVHDEVVASQVDTPVVAWAPLPDLGRWIEHADGSVTFVLAVVDHEGGDVAVHRSDLPAPQAMTTAGGDTENLNKVHAGAWADLKYQHRTENIWAHNSGEVADAVTRYVRSGVSLVLIAGDPQAKTLVRERLNESEATVVELEHGSRAEDGGDEALQEAVRGALLEHTVERRLERVHELRERLGRGEAAAAGIDDVADAFVRGQVDTLLIDPAAAAEVELYPRQHRGLSIGTDGPVRADLALVAAAVRTSAQVLVVGRASLGEEPAAALLRWDQ